MLNVLITASHPVVSLYSVEDLGQHSLGLLDADQVVCTHRFSHSRFTQVLVLVLTQPGDGLQTIS